jgi:membrane protein YdbS with pleckstrin-like domain
MAQEVTDAPRPRRARSVRESLASIVLGFETIIVFLAALLLFGLGSLPAWLALGGGALLCLVMVATIGLLRYTWSYGIGWMVQAVIVLTGFVNPAMFIVGALFTGMWAYCMITGSRLDNNKENS